MEERYSTTWITMNDEGIIKIFGHLVIRGGMCGDRENARRPEGPGKGIVPNLSQVYLGLTMATLLPFTQPCLK